MLSALSPVPESASPGHFYMSAFGPQGHLSASSEHGIGWRTLGTSTCPNTRDRVSPKNEHHLKKNCSWRIQREQTHLEGKPAALIRMVSRTPQALSCCTARFSSNLGRNKRWVWDQVCITWGSRLCAQDRSGTVGSRGGMWWVVNKVLLKLRGNRGQPGWRIVWARWHFLLASPRATGVFVCLGFEKSSTQVHIWKKR